MDEESLASLRNFQDENGFTYRKKLKKHQIRVMNKLPFSLIATNEQLSQSLFGTSQVQCLNFEMQNIELKNTNYVSFDYEKYCNQPIVENLIRRDIALKKTNKSDKTLDFNLRRSSRFSKRSIKECSVRIKELKISDILNYKLSKESSKFVEELARKDRVVPIRKTVIATEEGEDDDIIILSDDESNDTNDLSSNTNIHVPNYPIIDNNNVIDQKQNETNNTNGNLTNNSQLQNRVNYSNDFNRGNSGIQNSNKVYHFSKDNFENVVIKRPINNNHPYNRVKKARFNIQSFGKALSYHYNKYLPVVNKRQMVNKTLLQYKPIRPLNLKFLITNTSKTQIESTAALDKANLNGNSQRDKIEIDVIDLTI